MNSSLGAANDGEHRGADASRRSPRQERLSLVTLPLIRSRTTIAFPSAGVEIMNGGKWISVDTHERWGGVCIVCRGVVVVAAAGEELRDPPRRAESNATPLSCLRPSEVGVVTSRAGVC